MVTVCVVTMVLSFADEVAEAGSTIVLFWNGALEATEEEPVAAVFREPITAVFKATLEVVDAAETAVLFWNGASEAIEEETIAALFEEPINTVWTDPVAAVFKGTLDDVDKGTPAVLFWKGAPEVSGVGTTLPDAVELVVPLPEESTWKAEHMLAVLSLETNSPVSLLR